MLEISRLLVIEPNSNCVGLRLRVGANRRLIPLYETKGWIDISSQGVVRELWHHYWLVNRDQQFGRDHLLTSCRVGLAAGRKGLHKHRH